MSDIVDRLRGFADLFEAQHAPHNLVLHLRAGADEIERKNAEIASLLNTLADERTESMRLRAALRGLLQCPHIADRDIEPAWIEPETEDAIAIARAALNGKEGLT